MKHHPQRHYFIFAGEASGDLHGGPLVKALKQHNPASTITGVAGPAMRAQGVECLIPMEEFQVMGFSDVLAAFPKLWRQFHQVRDTILTTKPEVVILIDYPGFNLRLAKALRKKGFQGKIVQMICPTVWAWGKNRIHTMANTLDLLLTIYPFEADYFANTSLNVKYIGHPLVETIPAHRYDKKWKAELGIPQQKRIVGLFPGSRKGEIDRNLPLLLDTAYLFQDKYRDVIIALSCIDHEQMRQRDLPLNIYLIPPEYTYEMMRDCHAAIAKSGTVTLELALHNIPTAVIYQLSRLNRLIAKHLLRLRLPHYCIANIISGKTLFPEWIEQPAIPETLFQSLESLFLPGTCRTECQLGCAELQQRLGTYDTSHLAAQHIEELFSS